MKITKTLPQYTESVRYLLKEKYHWTRVEANLYCREQAEYIETMWSIGHNYEYAAETISATV